MAIQSFVNKQECAAVCIVSLQRRQYSGLPRRPPPLLWCVEIQFSNSTIATIANAPLLNSESGVGHLAMTNKKANAWTLNHVQNDKTLKKFCRAAKTNTAA